MVSLVIGWARSTGCDRAQERTEVLGVVRKTPEQVTHGLMLGSGEGLEIRQALILERNQAA
jgi:hypothetical protein